MTIELTENAISKIKEMATKEKLNPVIRAGVKGGGCAGLSHEMFFEEEENIKDTDSVFEFDSVKVIVDMMSMAYLNETTIDYIDGLTGTGFKFVNPHIKSSCGCGKSFSV